MRSRLSLVKEQREIRRLDFEPCRVAVMAHAYLPETHLFPHKVLCLFHAFQRFCRDR